MFLFNLFGVNSPRSLLCMVVGSIVRVRHSRMLLAGNPGEFRTCLRASHRQAGPPIKTFRGDNFGEFA